MCARFGPKRCGSLRDPIRLFGPCVVFVDCHAKSEGSGKGAVCGFDSVVFVFFKRPGGAIPPGSCSASVMSRLFVRVTILQLEEKPTRGVSADPG